jgi:hypothetical protein
MAPDRKPCEAQVVAVVELGVRERQTEKGAQKLIVGDHGFKSLLRKEMTPPARLSGSNSCLAAGARSLERFLRGR